MNAPFQLELLKLLAKVAWADHSVARTEASVLRDLARNMGFAAPQLAEVETWIAREDAVPEPDLALLRQHKHAVLAAVRTVVMSDDRIAPEETEILRKITAALS